MSETLSKTFSVLIIVAALALFLSSGHEENNELSSRSLLLFIIDFDSFMCLPCLESFLEFYHRLPSSTEKNRLWGILVFDASQENERGSVFIRILEKKLKGFIRANRIKFPIVIDRSHLFESQGKEGSAVLVFDSSQKVVKKFVFPLNQNQTREIMSLMMSR